MCDWLKLMLHWIPDLYKLLISLMQHTNMFSLLELLSVQTHHTLNPQSQMIFFCSICSCLQGNYLWFSSLHFTRSVVCNFLWPHGLQHDRSPSLSPTPRVYSNSCPLSQWCHPTISSSVIPFSSCLQSFPASGSFQISQFVTSGGQSTGVSDSASVLSMNI